MEIRRIDGRIDEVIAHGATVHMEDMGENGWYLRIEEGEQWWIFFQYQGEWTLFESSDDAPE